MEFFIFFGVDKFSMHNEKEKLRRAYERVLK